MGGRAKAGCLPPPPPACNPHGAWPAKGGSQTRPLYTTYNDVLRRTTIVLRRTATYYDVLRRTTRRITTYYGVLRHTTT
eukprot:8903030-Alexandrium_andersonii.AAC.1